MIRAVMMGEWSYFFAVNKATKLGEISYLSEQAWLRIQLFLVQEILLNLDKCYA